jgi:hypothetical protein
LKNKANIGTNVHEAIQMNTLGLPIPELNEREKKYFNSYIRWEEEKQPIYHSQEQRLYDESKMVTGQIDGVFSIPGEQDKYIIDFKTSSAPSHRAWAIQLGWYYLLAKTNSIDVERKAFMLQLKDSGAPAKLHEYEISDLLLDICHKLYEVYVYFYPLNT